jgi:hypothetical protein
VAECIGVIREIDACLKAGLKKINKRASKALQNKKGNAITACYFDRVQLFDTTGNFLLKNSHGEGYFRLV